MLNLDYKLYNHANKLLDEKIEGYGKNRIVDDDKFIKIKIENYEFLSSVFIKCKEKLKNILIFRVILQISVNLKNSRNYIILVKNFKKSIILNYFLYKILTNMDVVTKYQMKVHLKL